MANILTDGKGNGIPQYQTGAGEFLPLLGDKGPYSQSVDPNGDPLFTEANPAVVKVAESGAQGAASVTPNDSVNLTRGVTKGLYVGAQGDVRVTMQDGSIVTFNAIAPGVIHPISVTKVFATGTTASMILAVY
jgi:hypothetical protein